MNVESTAIPAERVPPIAEEMASNSRTYAGLLAFIAVILVIAVLGADATEPDAERTSNSSEIVSLLGAVAILGYVPVHFLLRHARNASRASRAARLAKADGSYSWRVSGKYVIGADGAGVPRSDVTFKINNKLRTMLLAFPPATVVDRS